jgi:hypothetical protein
MLAGLFFLAQKEINSRSAVVEGILMFLLIAITTGVLFTMRSNFDPLTHFLPMDAEMVSKKETSVSEKAVSKKPAEAETSIAIPNASEPTSSSADAIRNINNVTTDSHDNILKNTYLHPAMRNLKPIIWIPQDSLGIAADEIQETETSRLNLCISFKGAHFNDNVDIEIDGPPPEHVEAMETNSLNSG